VMALMIGALILQGIQPGPGVMTQQPALFWGVIVSMWIGNLFLLVLNLPLIGLWVRMISVPYHLLYPAILIISAIGVFSLNNASFDIFMMAGFGFLGYIFRKLDCEPAPMMLAFILGPMMEEYLRRALLLSDGDPIVLVSRPGSAVLLAMAAVLLVIVLTPAIQQKREEAFQE
jgi:putative tricarboxylic transport membrane protein